MLHIALVSCPGIGHIKPLMALAEEILNANEEVVTTVFAILTETQYQKLKICDNNSRLHFHYVVDQFASMPFDPRYEASAPEYVSDMIAYVDNHHLPPPICHIYDMFAGWSKLLADTYKIPSYLFMPCSLRASSLLFAAPPYEDYATDPEASAELVIEQKMRAEMETLMTPETTKSFQKHVERWKNGEGMLVNDIIELSHTLVVDKIKNSGTKQSYNIFTIGPVGLKVGSKPQLTPSDDNIAWLDQHEPNSVVYVALGSWCELPLQDLCELAFALRALQLPVLWAYRGVDPNAQKEFWISDRELVDAVEEDGLPLNYRQSLEPSTFRIVKWVDQKRVLSHPALRMFISHCGWNSTIEALSLMGKPIAALPIGAEQGCNAIDIEFSLKVGRRLWDCSRGRRLCRHYVVTTLKEILSNSNYSDNARLARTLIEAAKSPNGSSRVNMHKYLDEILLHRKLAS